MYHIDENDYAYVIVFKILLVRFLNAIMVSDDEGNLILH